MLQKAGGTFQLLSEVDFGTAFGLKSLYYKTRTSNPATAGQFRLARADVISWRNQANGANLDLSVDSSNNLTFNGAVLTAFTVTDTNSIDLTLAAAVLTADLRLSVAAASAGSTIAATSIVSDGLKVQMPYATALADGSLSSTDWSVFNNKQAALLIGNLTDAGTDGIVVTGGTNAIIGSGISLAQHVSDSTHNGYLSSTDWSTFNAKQAALLIGNITGTNITVSGGTSAIIGTGVTVSIPQSVATAATPTFAGMTLTSFSGVVKAAAGVLSAATLVNADVSASAAIAFSKLASLTSAHLLVGSAGNVATDVAITGDVTFDNAGVTTIGTNKVTNAKAAQMAANTLKGNNTGSTANAADLTVSQVNTLLGRNSYLGATSSVFTPGAASSGTFYSLTGNKVSLTAGTWVLTGAINFASSGAVGYTSVVGGWSTANGAFTAPTVDAGPTTAWQAVGGLATLGVTAYTIRITVGSTTDIYLVPLITAVTTENARITTSIYAERLA